MSGTPQCSGRIRMETTLGPTSCLTPGSFWQVDLYFDVTDFMWGQRHGKTCFYGLWGGKENKDCNFRNAVWPPNIGGFWKSLKSSAMLKHYWQVATAKWRIAPRLWDLKRLEFLLGESGGKVHYCPTSLCSLCQVYSNTFSWLLLCNFGY